MRLIVAAVVVFVSLTCVASESLAIDQNDNCPNVYNLDQSDVNSNGVGDACDDSDTDGDGLKDWEEWVFGTNPAVDDEDLDSSIDGLDSNPFDDSVGGWNATPLNNDMEFVRQVYRDFLNREADAGGLTYWVNAIESGNNSRAQVVENYLNSAEFSQNIAPVVRLYFTYYQRIPDYDGLMFWVNSYAAGTSLNDISDAFASAQEFIDHYGSLTNGEFVSQMYINVYGRQPDSGGLSYWTALLDSTVLTRGQVMVAFSSAEEYLSIAASQVYVTMTYIGLLRRTPGQGGFDFWVGQMDTGLSGLGLIADFLNSGEYAARFDDGSGGSVPMISYGYPYNLASLVEDENEFGNGTAGTRCTTTYTYDLNDRVILKRESCDNDMNDIVDVGTDDSTRTAYNYDDNGNIASIVRSNDWGSDTTIDSVWTTTYKTDPWGRVIQSRYAIDRDADGIPEVVLPTFYTWNSAGLLEKRIMAYDSNFDGIMDVVMTYSYNYYGNGQLKSTLREHDDRNDGNPKSITEDSFSWSSGRITKVDTTYIEDGNTTTDRTSTAVYSYDGNGNLTGIVISIDEDANGSLDYLETLKATFDDNNILIGYTTTTDIDNDGSVDYIDTTTPIFNATGMPSGSSLVKPDVPLMLPVQAGMIIQ